MELDSISSFLPAKGLVLISRRRCQKDRTLGQVKSFPVPLKGKKLERKTGKDGIVSGGGGQKDRHDSDFRFRPFVDTRPEAGGKELNSKANTPVRVPSENGFPHPGLFGCQPRERATIVYAHRSTHRNDAVEVPPSGELLPFVDFNPVDGSASLFQNVFVDAGGFAGDMLQNYDLHR
jgi:hypothetical protein